MFFNIKNQVLVIVIFMYLILFLMFFISLSTSSVVSMYLVIVLLFLLIGSMSFVLTTEDRLNMFFSLYFIYLIYYFFMESIFIVEEDFDSKQKLIVFFKLIIFYIMSSFLIFYKSRTKNNGWYLYAYFIFLLFVFSLNHLSILEKSIYYLNSFLPLLIVFFLLHTLNNIKIKQEVLSFSFYMYILSLLLSIYLLFDIVEWNQIFFHLLYKNSPFALVDGLPRTWVTTFLDYDFFRRFNGTLADPIIFGYLSSVMLIISIYSQDKKIFLAPLIFIFLLLSFSKGSIYLFLMLLILNNLQLYRLYQSYLYWFLFVLFIVGLNAWLSLGRGSSADVHYIGLAFPFLNIFDYNIVDFLFGHGFSSGGNLAKGMGIIDETTWLLTGSESGIGTIFYQTGLFGLIFVFYIFYKQIKISLYYAQNFLTIYMVLMFTQENLINMNYLLLLLSGTLVLNSYDINNKRNV